ncbi:phage tail assembly chaperone [Herbaspirillum frisingense]|uniref:phage tail assembly chaperone n=1 Tax=Herbaspirillum frisingense TaxID=92645 RepID=UPI0039AE995B
MLKLKPNPTFQLEVDVPVAGEAKPTKIKMTALYRDTEELEKLIGGDQRVTVDEFVMATITGWDEVDAVFSEAALGELLRNYHGVGIVIHRAYFNEVYKAARGN